MPLSKRNHWDRYASVYLEKMQTNTDRNQNRIIPAVLQLCDENLDGKRVLDLCCGSGNLSFQLEQRGACVVGVDGSGILLEAAKQQAQMVNSSVRFVLADAGSLPLSFGSAFNFIICNMALQDVGNATEAIEEVVRVGKPGAHVLLSFRHPFTDGWRENYLQEHILNFSIQQKWRAKTPEVIYPPRFHRSLSYYINTFLNNGMHLQRMIEVTDEPIPSGMPLAVILHMVLMQQ